MFVTISSRGVQLVLFSRLKAKNWRKLDQNSIKNYATNDSGVSSLNPGSEQIFLKVIVFACTFFF